MKYEQGCPKKWDSLIVILRSNFEALSYFPKYNKFCMLQSSMAYIIYRLMWAREASAKKGKKSKVLQNSNLVRKNITRV